MDQLSEALLATAGGLVGCSENASVVEETIIVKKSSVSCDGGGGALGHPKIYLAISEDGEIVCPYCSRKYRLADGLSKAAQH